MADLGDVTTLRGMHPEWRKKRNKTYAAGRVCEAVDCDTVLSIYNRSKYCWRHEPVRPYVSSDPGRKRKVAA